MSYTTGVFDSLEEFDQATQTDDAFVVYFNAEACNVGEALAPKVIALLSTKYPKMNFYYVDQGSSPDIAAQLSIFVVPSIIVYFGGRESFRKSRHFSIGELESAIARPYGLLFES